MLHSLRARSITFARPAAAVALLAATLVVVSPTPASAAPFAWDDCGGNGAAFTTLSLAPSPITGSGAAMPFRWEIEHDSASGEILETEFHVGAPVGNASAPLVRWPVPDHQIGSASYTTEPAGVPVPAGSYSLASTTIDDLTASWSANVTQELSAATVSSVTLTIEKKVFGVWIEIPALSQDNVSSLGNLFNHGDYYLKVELDGPGGGYLCTEMYFSLDGGATAPYVLRPVAPQCAGQEVTILGTAGDDVLTGTSGADVIAGLGGNDRVNGRSGNDVICGGDGEDRLDGGSDHDTVHGMDGDDTLSGGSGKDTLDGGDGADRVGGGSGKDHLTGGSGSPDVCDGGSGKDAGGTGCETSKSIP